MTADRDRIEKYVRANIEQYKKDNPSDLEDLLSDIYPQQALSKVTDDNHKYWRYGRGDEDMPGFNLNGILGVDVDDI